MITSEELQAAFKYLFIEEVAALKELARSLPDNPVVVNLGAGAGTSGLAFMESRKDLFLRTFDVQEHDSPLGCLHAEMQVIRQAEFDLNRYIQFCGDSKLWGKEWQRALAGPIINLVFIDADHSYDGCKGDILAWLPNIKEDGIMAVHDYGKRKVYKDGPIENAPHPMPWPGVDRAVRKFLCPYFEIVAHIKTLIAFRVNERDYSKLLESLRHNMADTPVV